MLPPYIRNLARASCKDLSQPAEEGPRPRCPLRSVPLAASESETGGVGPLTRLRDPQRIFCSWGWGQGWAPGWLHCQRPSVHILEEWGPGELEGSPLPHRAARGLSPYPTLKPAGRPQHALRDLGAIPGTSPVAKVFSLSNAGFFYFFISNGALKLKKNKFLDGKTSSLEKVSHGELRFQNRVEKVSSAEGALQERDSRTPRAAGPGWRAEPRLREAGWAPDAPVGSACAPGQRSRGGSESPTLSEAARPAAPSPAPPPPQGPSRIPESKPAAAWPAHPSAGTISPEPGWICWLSPCAWEAGGLRTHPRGRDPGNPVLPNTLQGGCCDSILRKPQPDPGGPRWTPSLPPLAAAPSAPRSPARAGDLIQSPAA